MKLLRRLLVIAVSMLACGLWASGQNPLACSAAQIAAGPCIDKIDPPGWWAGLPDPMLLVHGEGLNHARFTLSGKGVTLDKTQVSENGHWAFLWLQTKSAAPQTLWITARNDKGQSRRSYALATRSHQTDGHSGFSSADVLYLIMTDRFADGNASNDPSSDNRVSARGWHGGDLAGIEQHLDYLKQLGVTALWTTPVASNREMPEAYHGYAATDLYAVDPHFGTLADYQHLSDALHSRGMKLVIDLVPNHIGVKHPWVLDPPAPGWLHGTLGHHSAVQNDFYALVDPHAPPQAWRDLTDGWFTDAMPDLNQENPLVARYLIQNALWWVETANLDGIRLDTFPYVGRAFWRDFHATLHGVYPHLTTVGEIFHRDPEVTSYFAGGVAHQGIDTGLDTPFDFPVYFALRDVLTQGKPMTELAGVLRQDELYPHPERLVTFVGNHDTTRFLTDAGGSEAKLKLALGLIATLRGMPLIYSGDEIGMIGGADPDNRHDFPGGFAGDAHSAFTQTGRTATEQTIFAWTSGMLALRASHPALEAGLEQDIFADNDMFAFVRTSEAGSCSSSRSSDPSKERMLIVVNNAKHSESLELPMEGTALAACAEFQATAPATGTVPVVSGGKLHIDEPAESMTVYQVR
ncbi:MAG: alpha-amylase family glycosyl hydrolase [Terracidiphilus sp.]